MVVYLKYRKGSEGLIPLHIHHIFCPEKHAIKHFFYLGYSLRGYKTGNEVRSC